MDLLCKACWIARQTLNSLPLVQFRTARVYRVFSDSCGGKNSTVSNLFRALLPAPSNIRDQNVDIGYRRRTHSVQKQAFFAPFNCFCFHCHDQHKTQRFTLILASPPQKHTRSEKATRWTDTILLQQSKHSPPAECARLAPPQPLRENTWHESRAPNSPSPLRCCTLVSTLLPALFAT